MNTATQRPVSLRVGEFSIETLGVEYPDYFQGFGLGARSEVRLLRLWHRGY